MHRIDGPGATSDHKFTDGNPSTGTPATVVLAEWLNAVQEEIIAVLTEAGIDPNKASTTQLRDAIIAIATGGGSAITAAAVPIADAGNLLSGTNVEDALQELAAAVANGTVQAGRIRRSVIALTGASNNLAPTHLENILEVSNSTATTLLVRDDVALTAAVGATVTVFQAGAGKVTIAGDAGVQILKPSAFNAKTLGQHAAVVLAKVAANTWRVGGTMEAA